MEKILNKLSVADTERFFGTSAGRHHITFGGSRAAATIPELRMRLAAHKVSAAHSLRTP